MKTIFKSFLLLLMLSYSVAFGQSAVPNEVDNAAKAMALSGNNVNKRNAAFSVLEKAHKANPSDPYVASLFATALSLRAKYSDDISERVFWSKKSDILIDSVIAKNSNYLFAVATRGVNNSLAPAFLNLSDKARQDFEFVIGRESLVRGDQDVEALVMSYFYYAKLIQRQVSSDMWPSTESGKAQTLLAKLKAKYPSAYDRFAAK
jgi:hypothetical protein